MERTLAAGDERYCRYVTALPTRTVRTSDGLDLAVYEQGRPPGEAPTVVLVHGYPDNHTVWDGVAAVLERDHHVVRYDVRGAGASQGPASTRGYALPQLADDLSAVLAATSPDAPVHLVAHDWGSIQSWESVTDPAKRDLISSYTSISGPSLDMAAVWLRELRQHPREGLRQLLASYYVFAFQLPVLPELTVRSGLLDRLVDQSANIGVPAASRTRRQRPAQDALSGLELYRANFLGRMRRPRPAPTTVPVQVIAPLHDVHVTVALQTEAPAAYCTDFHWRTVAGNHWVVAQRPELVAAMAAEFIAYADGGPLPAGLTPGA
jgi:pimeloyl-ACP methyl ester carboxylesterase